MSTREKTLAESSKKNTVSSNASSTGNHTTSPGDLNVVLSTEVVSAYPGTRKDQFGASVRRASPGKPNTTAVAAAAKNGESTVENMRATVPASMQAATRQIIRNHTLLIGYPTAERVQLAVTPKAKQ